MNIVITGATGFVGEKLLPQLLPDNTVFALCRNAPPSPLKCIKYVETDITNSLHNEISLPKNIDIVIHLAQSRRFRDFPEGMEDMLDINVVSTLQMLELARSSNCQQFIYASTGSVYDLNSEKLNEQDCIVPKGAYATTKYMGEELVQIYTDIFPIATMRIFFPYGPGQFSMFIPNLIENIRDGEPISLQGENGGLLFSPLYVDDLCYVIKRMASEGFDGIINIAGADNLRLRDACGIIEQELGVQANYSVEKRVLPLEFKPNIDKLINFLPDNYSFIDFKEGIKRTIERTI